MARLIRAQTADGGTIIEFLDDVMQDRTEGFKTHHRIAAAKELIVHIVRDEQPSTPPLPRRERAEPVLSPPEGVRVTQSSFPRKACPVLDTGREPRGVAEAVAPQPTPLTLSQLNRRSRGSGNPGGRQGP